MIHRPFASLPFLLALAGLLSIGCGGDNWPDLIPVRGAVTLGGKPLTDGTVIYLPASPGKTRQATGAIQTDGSFEMTTHRRADGVMPGEYRIVIYAYEPHPGEPMSRAEREAAPVKIERGFTIPEKYTNPASSGLADTVDQNHSGFKQIDLVQ